MTRVLFTTAGMAAHVRPTIPLVRDLVENGHEVAWYTEPEFADVVTGSGAAFLPARSGLDFQDIVRRAGGRRGFSGLNRLVIELFIKTIPAYTADLEKACDQFAPDVIVSDHSFRPGLFVAEMRGLPRVAFSAGPLNLTSVDTAPFGLGWQPPSNALGRLFDRAVLWGMYAVVYRERQRLLGRVRAGLGLPALRGYSIDWVEQTCDGYLQTGVPQFEYPRRDLSPKVTFIGPTQPSAVDRGPLPQWWPELAVARAAGRPVVFVTQGTIDTDLTRLLLPTLTALAATDALVVATTSGQDPDELLPPADRPKNVRLARFLPYEELLPLADVVVTNGGYGGVQTALTHGVPLVVCGSSEDRMETNARVVRSGVGVSLRTDWPGTDRIADAVRTVLSDPSYRARAREMATLHARFAVEHRATAEILRVAGSTTAS
jgi:UDP:flavonoid glycosyltransferase YjiC (YdhE family)